MFNDLTAGTDIAEERDTLGGRQLLETALYDFTIELAYGDVSAGGARSLNLRLKNAKGDSHNEAIYVSSGKAKGGLNYWVDKDGNKQFLPGFSLANSICVLAAEKGLSELATETKTINIYNYEAKKEVPLPREVLMDLLGKTITLGIVKQRVDKKQKNAAGVYVATGETREENVIDKAFRTSDGMTVVEIKAEATEASFKTRWADKNTGVTRDKTTKVSPTTPPSAVNTPPANSVNLFTSPDANS